ncbi:hypothetical protein [Streptomyces sp. URMC 123]|uniref:hypothetical protein n=1 Tax=Streptomyces sp. URMC 123 TaxID=3423403 RepID=UPI003F1B1D5F
MIPVIALVSGDRLRAMLDFTGGVLTLLSLTSAVVWGLIATDRTVLEPRERLLAQGIHRVTAIASLGFLLLHITLKLASGHVGLLGTLVPFGLGFGGAAGLIGLGSLAAHLMVIAAATGALRSVFATPGPVAARWRALHALAYPAWCAALLHGLNAGRPAAGWVVAMYSLCLVAVALAVAVRLLPPAQRRRLSRLAASVLRPGPAPTRRRRARAPRTAPLPGMPPLPDGPPRPAHAPAAGDPLSADTLLVRRDTPPAPTGLSPGISAAYRAVSAAPPPLAAPVSTRAVNAPTRGRDMGGPLRA